MRQFSDKTLIRNTVTSIDLSQDMSYLLVGFDNGALALWNMRSYKLEKIILDCHETEIVCAKIYNLSEDGSQIRFVSFEKKGTV